MNKTSLPSPCYILEEDLLRRNLTLIRDVAQRAGVEIILAFKAYALWKTFPIIREYVPHSTASSIYEAQLAYEEMGAKAHTFSPAYTREEFPTILRYSSHVTFNSLSQIEQMRPLMPTDGSVSFGLRVNPEYSAVETDLYNPCAPGSRFGVPAAELIELPEGVEGFHFHSLCEGTAEDLEKTLQIIEKNFGHFLPRLKWLNMGGGHLMTRRDYDVEHLVSVLRAFGERHPNLHLILEQVVPLAGRRVTSPPRWWMSWSTMGSVRRSSMYPSPAICLTALRCPISPLSVALVRWMNIAPRRTATVSAVIAA